MKLFKRLGLQTVRSEYGLAEGESPFSANGVTGYSLNFPIAETCHPTVVCGDTCYAGCGPITWRASLAKQVRVMNSCKSDPAGFALLVACWYDRLKLDFLTWNGAGDLFSESVEAINWLGRRRPDITQWVRTRKPKLAGQISEFPSVFVHFSLDRSSMDRRDRIEWATKNYHYSYQYAPDEVGQPPEDVKIVFGHNYRLPVGVQIDSVCPLNTLESIVGACGACRKCFTAA